ncbi:MAG: hypothetical protein A3A97_00510 [Candidatus Terrybacteria bacterium RIFCSPLOWO2_01_FULL_40_23]|uniref:Gram-positive cocci surface proteins LPxTG domain-containing protein n=1 Tax=Candidatus Terrybacteria bacterium RIFCSPLOWO2_01_FULL_40_23 TaxID=1802366 RepID=A0A1G2PTM8_9BACT|nr:MAG: hypothetical protein A3A97_00510 [Candidatus Terrybacteria bacterium RIFCSPLOWO2_01_FULL_40_23]
MKYILSLLTIIFLSGAPIVLAHGDVVDEHEETTGPERRSGEVSPGAIAVFGAAAVGAGGYFVWLKLKQSKEPPKNDTQPKV